MSCTAHICRHHKRAHTCVTHTPAHACCNNRQKGPMVDKFRLTALRCAQAWGPRPAVVGYMMFPSQGSRTVTCCCPAADYLRPCRRPSPWATLVPCLLAPGPARPHLAAPHLPPPEEPRLRSGVWPGGALAGGVAQPVAASLLRRTRGVPVGSGSGHVEDPPRPRARARRSLHQCRRPPPTCEGRAR